MKKRIFAMLMVVLALCLAACGDGAGDGGGGGGGGDILKAMGPGGITYVFDSDSIAKSVRGVAVNSEYELKIVTPDKGGSSFTTDIFIVMITDIEPTGGNKKLTLVPASQTYRDIYGDSFEVTLNEKNEMYQINGIKGCPPGILTPIGENGKTMKGAWMQTFEEEDDDGNIIFYIHNSIIATDTQWTVKTSYLDEEGNIFFELEDNMRSDYTMSDDKLTCTNWERYDIPLASWGPCYKRNDFDGTLYDGLDGRELLDLDEPPYENDVLAVNANEISILLHYKEPINDGEKDNDNYVPQYEQEFTMTRVPTN